MKNEVLAVCSWLLSLFFIYFAYAYLRDGYIPKRFEEGRIERSRHPFNFWSGIAVAFLGAAFLIGLGVFILIGNVKL